MKMYNKCTLLCLLVCVTANFNKCFNYPFKSIHFIIPNNQIKCMINVKKFICNNIFFKRCSRCCTNFHAAKVIRILFMKNCFNHPVFLL